MNKFIVGLFLTTQLFGATLPQELIDAYHPIQHALAFDQMPAAQDGNVVLGRTITTFLTTETITENERTFGKMIQAGTELMAASNEEVGLRKGFELISEGFVGLVRLHPEAQPSLQLFYCPMAPGYRYWIQPKGETIANPYFGHKMQKCGSKKNW